MLDVPQFDHPHDYATHFIEHYGPTIVTVNNARNNGKEDELIKAMNDFTEVQNLGSDDARSSRSTWSRSARGSRARAVALAEGVGFEPTRDRDGPYRFSRPTHSTALPPLRDGFRLARG